MEGSTTEWQELQAHSQRVFVTIETMMDRYLCTEMHLTKEDIGYESMLSKASVRTALQELKRTGYITAKNDNSPVIKIGEPYRYGAIKIEEEKEDE